MDDKPVQCRVVQGKEPAHFRQLFKGKMIIHQGGKASGFKNTKESDAYDMDGVSLYHVKGSTALNTMAAQVAEEAKNLNSGDCFVLLTPTKMFSWMGSGSTDVEQSTATEIATLLKDVPPIKEGATREVVAIKEGEEPDDFWTAVGGKGEYPKMKPGEELPAEPRLFQCTNMTGVFAMEEIGNFAQDDLIDDDVMILDCYTTVYVWVGSGANEIEKRMAMDTANKYVAAAAATDGRDADTGIMQISASREPALFTTNFMGWDAELFEKNKFQDPYELRLAEERKKKEAEGAEAAAADAKAAADKKAAEDEKAAKADAVKGSTFSLEALQGGCPEGVDPGNKELFLDDDKFLELFGCDKAKWGSTAGWKKSSQKKKHGLF